MKINQATRSKKQGYKCVFIPEQLSTTTNNNSSKNNDDDTTTATTEEEEQVATAVVVASNIMERIPTEKTMAHRNLCCCPFAFQSNSKYDDAGGNRTK